MKLLQTLRQRWRPQEAKLNARSAVAPEAPLQECGPRERARELCRRGDRLLDEGAFDAALGAYQGAIDLADACAEGHVGQARAYLAQGRNEDAADSLEIALALEPESPSALHLAARVRASAGESAAAVELLRRAVSIDPARADILLELGLQLNRTGNIAGAIEVYAQAIAAAPRDPAPRVNLGLIHLQQLGESHAAEAHFRAALAIAPAHLEAAANLGLALFDQGRYDEAFEDYARGERQHPACTEFRWNRALGQLALGRYAEGWDDYELRLLRPGGRDFARFRYPQWDGTPLPDRRLLVLAEQGLGDEIMFASCLGELRALCAGVVLECAPRLAGLFARSFPGIAVHGVERRSSFDWLSGCPDIAAKVAIGSLPGKLRRSAQAFPAHRGYLHAESRRIHHYRERLERLGPAFKVGISWRAGTRATRGALRSVPLEDLQPLLGMTGVRFICLQHGMDEAERARVHALGMHVFDEALVNLDEGAALIAALDLTITAANTNAHLAGALGRPTWVLLNASPEWRWLRSNAQSLWYPSATLFRCGLDEGWRRMLTDVAARLDTLMADTAAQQGRLGSEARRGL